MVPSLEYLSRNVLIENSIRQMRKSRYKHYVVVGEYSDQYEKVADKIGTATVKLSQEILFVKLR
jgi:hypothetical protein